MTQVLREIAFDRNGRYLEYVRQTGASHRRVQFTSERLVSETNFTMFEFVGSKTYPELVHIRSRYNNRFLKLQSENDVWIVAAADEPEEDTTKWSCTVFRPRVEAGNNRLSLSLLARGVEAGVSVGNGESLIILRGNQDGIWIGYTRLEKLAILPKHVAFKGDNNMYLSSRYIRTRNRLQYASDNLMDTTVHHETFTQPNGDVRLRSNHFGRFWRKSNPEWIWCDTTDTTANDRDTVFRPVRLNSQGNLIALQNRGNNKYCMRWIRGGQPRLIETLTASSDDTNSQLTVMEMEEAVRDREIFDVHYRFDEARIYDVTPIRSVPQTASNWSQTTTIEQTLGFTYTEMTRQTFSSSHSWKTRVKTTITARIPLLVKGQIIAEASYHGSVNWSEVKETSEQVHTSIRVPVPPMTRATVTMVFSRGSIDVPFSYTQRDRLPNGRLVDTILHDGLFSGLNTEVIDYDKRDEPLSTEERNEGIIMAGDDEDEDEDKQILASKL